MSATHRAPPTRCTAHPMHHVWRRRCRGITDVTTTDFEYAKMLAGTVKLLGVAKLDDDRDELAAYVSLSSPYPHSNPHPESRHTTSM